MREFSPKNKKCDVLDKKYLEKFQEHMMHNSFHISNSVDVSLTSISVRFLPEEYVINHSRTGYAANL